MIQRFPIDFVFNFQNENLTQGQVVRTGDNVNFHVVLDGSRTPAMWELPANTVGEIEGIEIYMTPDDSAFPTVYNPLEYVRIELNEEELDYINFNELMAPFWPGGGMNNGKPVFRDGGTCINIGKALLAGGAPTTPTIKLKEMDKVRIVIKSPRAVRGGTDIDRTVIVRMHVCTADDFTLWAKYPEGFIDQSMMGYEKRIPADVDHWLECHGGRDAIAPKVERMITYGKNIVATTPHDEYQFYRNYRTVDDQWQNLYWELKDDKVVQITHIGLAEDESNGLHVAPNVAYIGIPHRPEELVVYPVSPYQHLSAYPMPLNRTLDPIFGGPGELSIPCTLHNENAGISIRDNGNAIDGWSETNVGVTVAVWGYVYYI